MNVYPNYWKTTFVCEVPWINSVKKELKKWIAKKEHDMQQKDVSVCHVLKSKVVTAFFEPADSL